MEYPTSYQMKNYIKKILSIIMISLFCITFCACGKTEETSNNSHQGEELTQVEPGIYIGEPHEKTNFIPKLSLGKDNTFKFDILKTYSYEGQYHLDDNRIILTITEEQSYTFRKEG